MAKPNETNAVAEAIEILGGQLEDVAVICRVTRDAVKKWIDRGRIIKGLDAWAVSEATAARGRRISMERLIGVPETSPAPEQAPARTRAAGGVAQVSKETAAAPSVAGAVAEILAARQRTRRTGWPRPSSRCGTNERPDLPVLLDDAA